MKKVIFLIIISVFLLTGCSVKRTEEVTDSEIFASEYAISKKNAFKYATLEELSNILSTGTEIIFFGNSDQEGCPEAIKIFSDLIDKNKIPEVYYYDPSLIMSDDNEKYHKLLTLINNALGQEENKEQELNIPSVYFIKEGKVIGYLDNISKMEHDEELPTDFTEKLKSKYLELIEEYNKENIQQ